MSEWISVKDRLPETDKEVLVYCYDKFIYTGYYYEEWENEGYDEGYTVAGFMHSCESCEIEGLEGYFAHVTHWMPLPEPPQALQEQEEK